MRVFALTMREKRYPRIAAFPIGGRGTASAVDRVLSLMAYLRRSPSLSFTPPSPSNLRPFGAPPSRGRREYPREPLPLEGAAERSEAGLASFFGGEAASSLPSPLGKAKRRRCSGALVNGALETISLALFYPASLIQPPPLRGTSFHRKEGVSTRAPALGRGCCTCQQQLDTKLKKIRHKN